MSTRQEVVNGVMDILVEMNWLDQGAYETNNILWWDKFMRFFVLGMIGRFY